MGLTVGGLPISQPQINIAKTALGVAANLQAGSIVSVAMIYAAMGESNISNESGGGVWQETSGGDSASIPDQAKAFLQGGLGIRAGGAIAAVRNFPSAGAVAIANFVEINAAFLAGGAPPHNVPNSADSYGGHLGGTAAGLGEAKAIVAAYGGNALKGGVAGASSGSSGTIPDGSSSTTYAFSISGTDNPDEDYWTGINRLAQDVNWYLFSNGEYLYYMDGQEMLAQQPAMHFDRLRDRAQIFQSQGTTTYDNTAFNYVSDHKRRFRTQRHTKVAIAQSPTEGSFQLICGIEEILGGDVIELSGFGAEDGRWIVGECRRSYLQVYSEITLVPALAPITEAVAAGTTGVPNSKGGTGAVITGPQGPGTLAAVAALAQRAAALQAQKHCYTYTPLSGRTNQGHGVLSPPFTYDCSGFTEACYKFSGLGDPAGNTNYAGSSFNIAENGACVKIDANAAVPGDCVVFPNHVVVYLGGGQCVSMGGQGDPIVTTVAAEAAYENRGITGYFHLKGAK